ncbi:hypothetical protein CTI12_AA302290 [Artemisia annua]|uniref:Replication protein A 70 kDa DNA-binding subunit B/D first OB fold domain-containing protein n=1 Tax=Artemisia annua TaxID=35608 RepID=A0A2U1N6F2_ARTAN|nr:hypothetical protein CTI12_AA302290 [Artemisia annua]
MSFGYQGKHASSVNDLEFTALDEIDPMLYNIKIKARCISVWHSHPGGKPNQAYSFDIVLQDMKGNRIQCTARNNDMYRFEPLFQQGHCYIITDFSVGENNGILPLLNHKYKITFFQSTKVTRIDHFDEDVFGFKLEPFSEILSKRYHEKDSVDVVGVIVAIGNIIQVHYSDGDHKIEVFTPLVVKITPEIFFKNTVKTTVGGIRALQPEGDEQFKTPDVSDAHTGGLDAASLSINKFLLETPDNQAQSSTSRTVAASLNINKFLLETPDNQANSSTSRSV